MLYSPIVAEPVVEIPNRPVFRASEVCEIAQIPPYVLKSWEKEFPGLGVVAKPGGPRVYRRTDVEQVVRIKHLLFAEGLTLAGARRKLEGEPKVEEEPLPDFPVPGQVREKVSRIKQELRGLLDLLSAPPTVTKAATPTRESLSMPGSAPDSALQPEMDLALRPGADPMPDAARDPALRPPADHAPEPARVEPPVLDDSTADLPLLHGAAETPNPAIPARRRRPARR
jgi:DNA-binding transcriptional MerR regulator